MAKRRRRNSYDYGTQTWWTRDIGGLPGWACVLAALILVGCAVVVGALALG